MSVRFLFSVAMAVTIGASSSGWAHHSNVLQDLTKTQVITGMVKEVRLANPHSYIVVVAPDPRTGKEETWTVEGAGNYALARMGIRPGVIHVGDTITLSGHPERDGSRKGTFSKVVVNGKTFGQ